MINLNNTNLENLHDRLLKALEKERVKQLVNSSELLNKIDSSLVPKLKFIEKIKTLEPSLQRKFLGVLINIVESNREDFDKLELVTTYGALLSEINNNLELLTDSETMTLLFAMRNIPIDAYNMYGYILSSKEVMEGINNKVSSEDEQIDLIIEILDLLDEIAYEDMDPEELSMAINSCKIIISKYRPKEEKKSFNFPYMV